MQFIDWAVREQELSVALIPHVVDTRAGAPLGRNDYLFLRQIEQRVKSRNKVVLIDPSFHVREMKYMISRCRFFIGSRTHSTISALSSGVPTISLSYSMKSRGINRDVVGNEDFVLATAELSFEGLRNMFCNLRKREEEFRSSLQSRIPAVKEKARQNARYLGELLGVKPSEKWGKRREP